MKEVFVVSNLTCAIISAKWALELGYSQLRQIICLVGGLLLGPLMLLILYVYLIRKARAEGQAGGRVV